MPKKPARAGYSPGASPVSPSLQDEATATASRQEPSPARAQRQGEGIVGQHGHGLPPRARLGVPRIGADAAAGSASANTTHRDCSDEQQQKECRAERINPKVHHTAPADQSAVRLTAISPSTSSEARDSQGDQARRGGSSQRHHTARDNDRDNRQSDQRRDERIASSIRTTASPARGAKLAHVVKDNASGERAQRIPPPGRGEMRCAISTRTSSDLFHRWRVRGVDHREVFVAEHDLAGDGILAHMGLIRRLRNRDHVGHGRALAICAGVASCRFATAISAFNCSSRPPCPTGEYAISGILCSVDQGSRSYSMPRLPT